MHQPERKDDEESKPQPAKQRKSKELPAIPDDPDTDDPDTDSPDEDDSREDSSSVATKSRRPMTRAKAAAGKGQLQSPASSKRSSPSAQSSPQSSTSPKSSKSSQSSTSQSTPSPIRRMRRIVQPPRDPNKPTWLESKFAHNKGVRRTSGNAQRPANATPIKDRGLRASLE